MPDQRNIVIVIAGPTAVGKTGFSIQVASQLQTEIISADSRQIYKEMTIGTAKPTEEELKQVPHHLVNCISIHEDFNAGMYERKAIKKIAGIHKDHEYVVVSGGTGLYIKAIVEGLDQFPHVSEEIHAKWQTQFETHGLSYLQDKLKELDPVYYQDVDLSNHRRLLRALTVTDAAGKPYSAFRSSRTAERPFETKPFVLLRERNVLYERINNRVDRMLEQGLLAEARTLFPHRHKKALQTVGYQELFRHLEGRISLQEAVDQIKTHSRQYAKRQMTWFRNQGNFIEWQADDFNGFLSSIKDL